MNDGYGRDLDLNLLRVFLAVAEQRSVTRAASVLYVTQPAVSAALRRLTVAVGAPLFTRQGRGLTLTERGTRLVATVRPHLHALLEAALVPARFDPATSHRLIRLGLSDATEMMVLPPLLQQLAVHAPNLRVIATNVQFRTVEDALVSRTVDLAVTVADRLPQGIRRQSLIGDSFVCLFDPKHLRIGKRIQQEEYFEFDHVLVSYNGDLRGIVEDVTGKQRRVRCSVSSFANVGAIVDDSNLVATIPSLVAREIVRMRPHLRTVPDPFGVGGGPIELLWPSAVDDDEACAFVRAQIVDLYAAIERERKPRRPRTPS